MKKPASTVVSRIVLLLAVVLVGAVPRAARAEPPFGGQGQAVLDGTFQLIHQSSTPPMGSGSSTTVVTIAPAVDYFLAPNVSLGGALALSKGSVSLDGSPTSLDMTGVGVEARVGYNIRLSDGVSFWPRVGINYAHTSISSGGGPDDTMAVTKLVAFAPFLFHPVAHFFLGIGPLFTTDLSSSASSGGTSGDGSKTTDIGIQSIIGGWL